MALKTIPYDQEYPDYGQRRQAIGRGLHVMDHPHVTRCFGSFVTREGYKLVLERMQCNLQDAIGAF